MRFVPRLPLVAAAPWAAAVLASALFASSDAHAQVPTSGPTVSITGVVTRVAPAGGSLPDHPQGVMVNVVNFSDCYNDETLHIPLTLGGNFQGTGNTLEAWAGEGQTDCTQPANRTGSTVQCWQVKSGISGTVANTAADIRVQDIVSQFGQPTKTPTPAPASQSACSDPYLTPGPHTITVYIFFTNGTSGQGTAATYQITASMQAPALSGPIGVGEGDTILKITLPSSTDATIKGYDVYCDPPKGGDASPASTVTVSDASADTLVCPDTSVPIVSTDSATSEASSSADAGDDGSATDAADSAVTTAVDAACYSSGSSSSSSSGLNPGCPSTVLAGGTTSSEAGTTTYVDEAGVTHSSSAPAPPPPSMYKCGHVDGLASTVQISGLTNGQPYAIAAASTDLYGNVGPISATVCGTPKPINDFWDLYSKDGGGAGGDFCALEAVGMPAGTAMFGFGFAVAGLALVRRRRRS